MTTLMNRPTGYDQPVPLREAINSLFSQSFLGPAWGTLLGTSGTPGMALDVYEDNNNYYLLGVLPGVDPNKLELTSQENTLVISGTIPSFVPQGTTAVWQELPSGTFRRVLTLPAPFESDKVQAQYQDGLLRLVLPKAEHARVKRIPIGTPHTATPSAHHS